MANKQHSLLSSSGQIFRKCQRHTGDICRDLPIPQLLREGMEMMIDPLISEKHLNLDCPFDSGLMEGDLVSCLAAARLFSADF